MAFRRIAVEEAFITQGVLDGWRSVLASNDVEPRFALSGGSLLGPGEGSRQFENLLDIGRSASHT